MTDAIVRRAASLAWLAAMFVIAAVDAHAQPATGPAVTIGYLELEHDRRYEPLRLSRRIILQERARPYAGAQLAIADAEPAGDANQPRFSLERISAPDKEGLAAALDAQIKKGIRFVLVDAPAGDWPRIADAAQGKNVVLFNVAAADDELRRNLCRREVVHTMPSRAMLMDALVQQFVSRKWRELLVLEGTSAEDARDAAAFVNSAKKFGARIVAHQKMKPGTDPRDRDFNNPALLTATSRDYDVVFVADRDLEIARELPYRISRPRPIAGGIDLEAAAWAWTFDRFGAPQVNSRFMSANSGRRMSSAEWASWIAAKMITHIIQRDPAADFARQRALLLDDGGFDGSKGLAVSVRRWDQQLRQPILLATPNAVVAVAPVDGFLHQVNRLDTLGDDAAETPCRLDRSR